MVEQRERDFSAIDRRMNFLRQELYSYDKYLRHPAGDVDMATQAKFAADADDYQMELDDLMYLRGLVDKARQPSGVALWQAILLAFFSSAALLVAVMSLFVAAQH